MLRQEDRRDLGHLGLLLAIYGLAFAPLLHAVYGHGGAAALSFSAPGWVRHGVSPRERPSAHDERVPHSHEPSGKHESGGAPASQPHHHGSGSVEHLQALALAAPLPPCISVIASVLEQVRPGTARPRLGESLRSTAMPQGP